LAPKRGLQVLEAREPCLRYITSANCFAAMRLQLFGAKASNRCSSARSSHRIHKRLSLFAGLIISPLVGRSTSVPSNKQSIFSSSSSFSSQYLLMALLINFACVLSCLAILNACTVTATNPCFFPNGDLANNFVPCSPNGDGSCCAESDFCTSLGYCISDSKGYHYRGACTDSSWFNPSCPDYCLANTICKSICTNVYHFLLS
jgi:hypothetical protein